MVRVLHGRVLLTRLWLLQAVVTQAAHPVANQTLYNPLFEKPSNSTPRSVNVSQQSVNLLFKFKDSLTLHKRADAQEEGTCAPGTPCVNGACCSNTGVRGYSEEFCGADNCISNCDAKTQCGQYAEVGKEECPLNFCCSKFGWRGTTEEFCEDECDESGSSCGPASPTGYNSPAGLNSMIA